MSLGEKYVIAAYVIGLGLLVGYAAALLISVARRSRRSADGGK
jgi:hypothetical protein